MERYAPFASLPSEARVQMLAIGPVWAQDIVAHRKLVLAAYEPVLAARPSDGIEVVKDIAYGAHAWHRVDVYAKPGLVAAPVVAFVHGGAFVRGEKDATPNIYGNVPRYFARHGCVGINVEYRLAPEAAYPGGAQDVAAAMAWIRANVAQHGGDPSRIVLVGHSAGASHAGAYACDPAARPAEGPGLAGLVLISGRLRADVRADNPNAHGVRAYYGSDVSAYEARSVVTHAGNADMPLLIAVAEHENPYLDAYSAEMAARVGMHRRQMPRFIQLPGQNHTSMVAHFDAGEELLDREVLAFVRGVC
jgi:acetyl esterase/lipase